ncbi:phosphate acyltransferase, partial [uncultured Lactobacillus sp.]
MKVFDSLKKKAEESKKVIVFPEGNDERIIRAAIRLAEEGIVEPLLLGKPDEVIKSAEELNVDLDSIEIINPAVYP